MSNLSRRAYQAAIKRLKEFLGNEWLDRAVYYAGSSRLAKAIKLDKVFKRKVGDDWDRFTIDATLDLNVAPDALAREYGSGLWSTSNIRSPNQMEDGKIRIYPKTASMLAFHWKPKNPQVLMVNNRSKKTGRFQSYRNPKAPYKFIGRSKETKKWLWRYVDHPGVQAQNNGEGYIRKAYDEIEREFEAKAQEEIGDATISRLRVSIEGIGKRR